MLEQHGNLGVYHIKLRFLALLILKKSLKAWRRGRDWKQSSSSKQPTTLLCLCIEVSKRSRTEQLCVGDEQRSLSGAGESGKGDYTSGYTLQGMREPEGSQHCLQLLLAPWAKALRDWSL